MKNAAPKPRVDSVFLGEYARHVANSPGCLCTSDGPDDTCNIGSAVWRVAHQVPWDERKAEWLRGVGAL